MKPSKLIVFCAIWYHLYNFKSVKNTHGGVLLLVPVTLLKVTLLHGCFSRFLNCTNGTKSRNASRMVFGNIPRKLFVKFGGLGTESRLFSIYHPNAINEKLMRFWYYSFHGTIIRVSRSFENVHWDDQKQPFADGVCTPVLEPVLEFFFKKIADLKACNFTKKRHQHRCFPVNIAKFLRTACFIGDIQWLLLDDQKY